MTRFCSPPHLTPERASALLDRELSPAEEMTALEHVASCRECRDAFGPLVEVDQLLALPAGRSAGGGRRVLVVAAAAALLMVIVAVSASKRRLDRPGRPPAGPAPAAAVIRLESLVVTSIHVQDGVRVQETWRGGSRAPERSRAVVVSPTPGLRGDNAVAALTVRSTHSGGNR